MLSVLFISGSMTACNQKPDTSDSDSSAATTTTQASDVSSGETGDTATQDSTTTGGQGATTAKTAATSSNSSSGGNSSGSKPVVNADPTKGVNLNKKTIVVYTSNAGGVFNRKQGSSTYGNAVAKRLSDLEKALNCTVKVNVKPVEDLYTLAFTTISSGDKFADIMEVPVYKTCAYISSKLAVDLKSVSTMDLSKSYLNAGDTVTASTLGKRTYFVGTEDMYAQTVMGYFFNKTILKECGYKENYIYDLVSKNQWTVSKLREMAKKATKDLDGKPGLTSADRFGMLQTSYSADATEALLAASGAQMLKHNKDGSVTYNMDSKDVIDTINLANAMWVKDNTTFKSSSGDEELHKMFMSGHGLFLGCGSGVVTKIMDMDDDFGFVPFPRGDKASKIVGATNWNSSTLMIPTGIKGKDLEDAGKFLQAFCYTSPGVAKVMYQEYSDRYYRDDQSSKMLSMVATNQKLAVATILGSTADWTIHEGTYKVLYGCVPGGESAQKMVSERKSRTVTALKELMAKINK